MVCPTFFQTPKPSGRRLRIAHEEVCIEADRRVRSIICKVGPRHGTEIGKYHPDHTARPEDPVDLRQQEQRVLPVEMLQHMGSIHGIHASICIWYTFRDVKPLNMSRPSKAAAAGRHIRKRSAPPGCLHLQIPTAINVGPSAGGCIGPASQIEQDPSVIDMIC